MKKRIGKAAGTWARHLQKDRKLQRAANKIIREESREIERTVKSENKTDHVQDQVREA